MKKLIKMVLVGIACSSHLLGSDATSLKSARREGPSDEAAAASKRVRKEKSVGPGFDLLSDDDSDSDPNIAPAPALAREAYEGSSTETESDEDSKRPGVEPVAAGRRNAVDEKTLRGLINQLKECINLKSASFNFKDARTLLRGLSPEMRKAVVLSQPAWRVLAGAADETFLHKAARYDRGTEGQHIALLLEPIPDPAERAEFIKRQNGRGQTALHLAVQRATGETLRELLNAISDPAQKEEILRIQDNDGKTALHYSLKEGCGITKVSLLLNAMRRQERAAFISIQDYRGNTVIHDLFAADKRVGENYITRLKEFVSDEEWAAILAISNVAGQTAESIIESFKQKLREKMRKPSGAAASRPALLGANDSDDELDVVAASALAREAYDGSSTETESDEDSKRPGVEPVAAGRGNAVAEKTLRGLINQLKECFEARKTQFNLENARTLLTGLSPEMRKAVVLAEPWYMPNNETFLHKAARYDRGTKGQYIALLLEPIPDPAERTAFIKRKNWWGQTALHLAAGRASIETLNQLLNAISDPAKKEEILKIRDNEGKTALHYSLKEGGGVTKVWVLLNAMRPQERADFIKIQDNRGNTVIHDLLAAHKLIGENYINYLKKFVSDEEWAAILAISNVAGQTAESIIERFKQKLREKMRKPSGAAASRPALLGADDSDDELDVVAAPAPTPSSVRALREGVRPLPISALAVAESDAPQSSKLVSIHRAQEIVNALNDTVRQECSNLIAAYGKDGVFFGPQAFDYTDTAHTLRGALDNPTYVLGLITQGANPAPTARLGKEKTALHVAALKGNQEIFAILLSKMSEEQVAAVDEDGNTARDLAEQAGHESCVELVDKYICRWLPQTMHK